MRKTMFVVLPLLVVASLMFAACSVSFTAPASTATPAPTQISAPPTPSIPALPELKKAWQFRIFSDVKGWVSGGEGQWVAGAQVETKFPFALNTLPNGVVFEFECVQYSVLSGKVQANPVCDGAIVRFDSDSIVPTGSVGTFWMPWAVVSSTTEEWSEGFLNKPCKCPSGDCRK